MMTDDFTVTHRDVTGRQFPGGCYVVSVTGYDHSGDTEYYVPRKGLGSYAFIELSEDLADVVRGDVPDVDGTPVMHIGSNLGKNYYTSHDNETVPVDVLEWLHERDLTLVRDVEGGWHRWGGRPEFSETKIDFTDVEVVDMETEIADRRESDR